MSLRRLGEQERDTARRELAQGLLASVSFKRGEEPAGRWPWAWRLVERPWTLAESRGAGPIELKSGDPSSEPERFELLKEQWSDFLIALAKAGGMECDGPWEELRCMAVLTGLGSQTLSLRAQIVPACPSGFDAIVSHGSAFDSEALFAEMERDQLERSARAARPSASPRKGPL